MNQRSTMFVVVALLIAFVLLPLALYAFRSQTPAIAQVPISAATQDVQGGRFADEGPPLLAGLGAVLLGLLPIALISSVAILAARVVVRPSRVDVYGELARAADLRDRGVLSEDEFQREKQKILGRR